MVIQYYLFDGSYAGSMEQFPTRIYASFPNKKQFCFKDDQPHFDCNCQVEDKPACPSGTNVNDCCKFELIMHSTPHVDDNGTLFSCGIATGKFTKENTATMCK